MVGQDQAPNRSDNDSSQPGPQMIRGIYARSRGRGNGSGSTKPPSDFVALGRPRGVTGSDLTMSPNDLVAVAYQRVFVGSDTTKAPSDI